MAVPIFAIAMAAYSAYSSYNQAQLSNKQKRMSAEAAELNAETAELEGDLAFKAAFQAQSQSRRQTEQLIGLQRASMSATGFAADTGSFSDIIESTVVMGEIDVATIMFEGELTRFRKRKEAEALREEAKALRKSETSPGLAGLGGALAGFASSQ